MKLQKHLAYEYNKKKHYKYVLNIPSNALEVLGWKPGEDLEQVVEDGRLIIRPNHDFPCKKNEPHDTRKEDFTTKGDKIWK